MNIRTAPDGRRFANVAELWGEKCRPELKNIVTSKNLTREVKISLLTLLAFTTMEEENMKAIYENGADLKWLCTKTVDGWEKFKAMSNN
jgi:hypothetical protein